jgi:hypothetical protein
VLIGSVRPRDTCSFRREICARQRLRRNCTRETQLPVHHPRMPQGLDDQLLRVPVRDVEPSGDLARGQLLVVMEAQHLALGGVEAGQDAPHDELPLDPVRLGGHHGLGDGVEARAFDCVYTHTGAQVRTAGIANRANEECAGIDNAHACAQQRQHGVVYQALTIGVGDIELPRCDREQERAVGDVELAYVGRGR